MDFSTRTLGEICDEVGGTIRTGPFGSQLHESDYSIDGTPVIMPMNIIDGWISTNDIAHVDDEHRERLRHHQLKTGDIVYGRRGDIGRRAIITDRENGWLCGTGCIRLSLGAEVVDPWFLYYYLGQKEVVDWIYNQAIGATMPNLNTSILRSVPVAYPLLHVQRRIASMLSAYDDLIENNTRRIAILEEMARALYHEWFVHFRFPGHEHVPLVDSPLGPIPEGWEVDTLQNLAVSFQDGDWIETKDQGGDAYRLLQVSNIGLGEFVETGNWRFITQETFERLRCCEVIENDLLISRMPKPIGRAWMVTRMPFRMVTAVDVAILRVNESRADKHYLYCALNSPWNLDRVLQHSSGTTRARIARRNLASLPFLVPPLELQQRFAKLASATLPLSALLREESANLRTTRDLLLPKLISGEIDVSQLPERPIAEAAD